MDPVLLAAVAAVAGLGAAVWLWGRRRRGPAAEPVHHFKCAHCGRRIGYAARQAGHRGACPQCKRPLTFPPAGRAAE